MLQCISEIPKPTTLMWPLIPNRPGVNALGTSTRGLINERTFMHVSSLHPASLAALRHTLYVAVAGKMCLGFTSAEVSPSPNFHVYFVAPTDSLIKLVNVFSCGGFGL